MAWVGAGCLGAVVGWLTVLVACPGELVRVTWPSLIFILFFWSVSAAAVWFQVDQPGLVLSAVGAFLGLVAANVLHSARQAR